MGSNPGTAAITLVIWDTLSEVSEGVGSPWIIIPECLRYSEVPDTKTLVTTDVCDVLSSRNLQYVNSCGLTFLVSCLYLYIPSLMSVSKGIPVHIRH